LAFRVFSLPLVNRRAVCFIISVSTESSRNAAPQSSELEQEIRILDAALSNTVDFNYVFDLNGCFIYINRTLLNLWGKTLAEAVGKNFIELDYPAELAAQLQRQIQDVIATKRPLRDETPYTSATGTRSYEYIFAPVLDSEGNVEMVAGSTRDITDRKLAEEQLRDAQSRLSAIIAAASVGTWVWQVQEDRVFADPALAAMFSVSPEAANGGPIASYLAAVHPDDVSGLQKVIEDALHIGKPYEAEYRLRLADGGWRWVNARGRVDFDAEGKAQRFSGAVIDVTARKRDEEALAKQTAALRDANLRKDSFLAALSHELRTPLTPVLMTAAALEGEPDLSPEIRAQITMMRRNIELEARLIDDLLDLTRITHGKFQVMPLLTDLHELLRHTVEIVHSDEFGKQVRIINALNAGRHHVFGDPARLQQVFWNVIKNAIKFTPRGGSVTITTRNDDEGWIDISIEDTGIGIRPESLPNVFNAFEQGDAAGQHRYGGLGLGLAISNAVIEAHGGTIKAESEGTGYGATFTISLATMDPPLFEAAEARSQSPQPTMLRLLVVEDHEATRTVLNRLLTRQGHEVTAVGSVRDALTAFDAAEFDGVISDLGLPDGSGLDLMREIQSRRNVAGIALTGYGMEDDVRQTKEAGFFAHLVKPVNFDELRRLLTTLKAQDR
jgi:PAS domain S-box-containing protein